MFGCHKPVIAVCYFWSSSASADTTSSSGVLDLPQFLYDIPIATLMSLPHSSSLSSHSVCPFHFSSPHSHMLKSSFQQTKLPSYPPNRSLLPRLMRGNINISMKASLSAQANFLICYSIYNSKKLRRMGIELTKQKSVFSLFCTTRADHERYRLVWRARLSVSSLNQKG